MMLFQE